jgi:predicted DNA-binding transcriptional regulator AlpA
MENSTASTPADEIMTPPEAAAYLKLRPSTLAGYRTAGQGPKFCKIGAVRYRRCDLDAWIASKLVSSTSEAA